MNIIEKIYTSVKGKNISLVLPEGTDERVIMAASRIMHNQVANVILIGDLEQINTKAMQLNVSLDGITLIDPDNYPEYKNFVSEYVKIRGEKTTQEQAEKLMKDPTHIGTMMIKLGMADALLSGAVNSTANTVRPALQIIKTKPTSKLVSSGFYMFNEQTNQQFIFGDCAINVNPNAEQLADIAFELNELAKVFELANPKTAFLSFSTKGSAVTSESKKVVEAYEIFKQNNPTIEADGELQLDAAIVPSVGHQKAPDSKVAGNANILVFPDINSGNIGYKIAQRLGNFTAIGPILIGLNAPINDLSRGCSVEDIYETAIITVAQAMQTK